MHFCWIFLYKQKCFFSVITNNLNWEILNKNSVTFKRWDGVKDQHFWYCRGFTEKSDIGGEWGGVPEKPIYREELLKKGGLGQFPDLGIISKYMFVSIFSLKPWFFILEI